MDCFSSKSHSATSKEAHVPATRSTDAIPSTSSGVNNHSDVLISATSTRSTLINDPTQVHSSTSITYHSDVISNTSTDEEMHNEDVHVTTFRPVYESEKKSQFERQQEDTTLDCQDRLDAHDKLHCPQD